MKIRQGMSMASVTSSSPSFASNSADHSATQPPTPPRIHPNVKSDIDTFEAETPPIVKQEQEFKENPHSIMDRFEDLESKEFIERYENIENDYANRLMTKYFSGKDIFGDDVFDGKKVDDSDSREKARIQCAESYADPVQYLKNKKNSKPSSTFAETQTSISNGKRPMKKEEK